MTGVAVEYAGASTGAMVAYAELGGEGPPIVYLSGAVMPIEAMQEDPVHERFLRGLAELGRLFVVDRRGIGASDPPDWEAPLVPQWVDDVESVLHARDLRAVTIMGHEAGASVALGVAARAPERVERLVLLHGPAGDAASRQQTVDDWQARMAAATARDAEQGELLVRAAMPSRADDPMFRAWFDRAGRLGASPATAARIWNGVFESSLRDLDLAAIGVPALVLHRVDCAVVPVSGSRSLAARLPNARLVLLPGADFVPYSGDVDALLAEITAFVAGDYRVPAPDRSMLALLFTDLVASTARAVAVGDAAWRGTLARHDQLVRSTIGHHSGALVKTTGDGILATFPTVSRALSGARELRTALADAGLEVRMGVHVGEVELAGSDVVGVAVHAAARIMEEAVAGEILVSSTAAAVAAGGGHRFARPRPCELRGLEGVWEVCALE